MIYSPPPPPSTIYKKKEKKKKKKGCSRTQTVYKRHYSVNSQHNTTQNRPKFDLVSECRTAHSIVVCLRLHKRDNVCLDWVRKRNQVIPAYQPSCQLQVHTVSVYMCIPSLSPGFPEKYWIFFQDPKLYAYT